MKFKELQADYNIDNIPANDIHHIIKVADEIDFVYPDFGTCADECALQTLSDLNFKPEDILIRMSCGTIGIIRK